MTTPAPMAQSRPDDPTDAALFDAVATEHATIYGYGLVSAHSTPDVNYLVSDAMAEHRARREAAIAMLTERGVDAPLPASGYRMPSEVDTPTDAVNLAIVMEEDAAVAWRAVVEQAADPAVRMLGVTSLTECAITAARWRVLRGDPSVTVAFPGGAE